MEVQTEAISEVKNQENSQEQMTEEIRRSNFGSRLFFAIFGMSFVALICLQQSSFNLCWFDALIYPQLHLGIVFSSSMRFLLWVLNGL